MPGGAAFIPLSDFLASGIWPEETLRSRGEEGGALEDLAYEDLQLYRHESGAQIDVQARVMDELVFPLPFLDSVGIVIGGDPESDSGQVSLRLEVDWSEEDVDYGLKIGVFTVLCGRRLPTL